MSTHELFQKHFGNTAAVDMKHPNIESFFEELNTKCLAEDKQKNCNIPDIRLSVCSVCGKKFGEVKKCYNVKCTNPFQTEA